MFQAELADVTFQMKRKHQETQLQMLCARQASERKRNHNSTEPPQKHFQNKGSMITKYIAASNNH